MAKLLGSMLLSFANVASRDKVRDDDTVDQLNHWATVGFLTAMAVGTGAKQFVGSPIKCWLPAQYKKKMYQEYADNYCWIHHMYYVPFSEAIAFEEEDRWDVDISFYRWVTVMFLLQALLFKVPNLLWRELKGYSGLNMEKVVGIIQYTATLSAEERVEKLSHAAIFMHRWLKSYSMYRFNTAARVREQVSGVLFCFGKRTGTYLTGLYMFIKTLYIANSLGQFFMLSAFLGVNYWSFGVDAMSVLAKEGKWQDHYTFPRVGLCDYKIRQMNNVQTFSVQCVLAINLFLEKMYLVLWFWMIGLLAANIINLGLWFIDNVLPGRNERFMFRYAKMIGIESTHEKTLFRLFTFNYLRRDGIFILRMVAKNTSSLMCLELVRELWKVFQQDLEERDSRNGAPNSLNRQPSAPADDDDDDIEDAEEVGEDAVPEKPPLN
ncbi:innexin unc-9-like [Babylonia areolata]|uniref:innexin unc-9-like n=1 Tax=Babylonia areolata TaxID=304850 RepID=UPI003FD1B0CA